MTPMMIMLLVALPLAIVVGELHGYRRGWDSGRDHAEAAAASMVSDLADALEADTAPAASTGWLNPPGSSILPPLGEGPIPPVVLRNGDTLSVRATRKVS